MLRMQPHAVVWSTGCMLAGLWLHILPFILIVLSLHHTVQSFGQNLHIKILNQHVIVLAAVHHLGAVGVAWVACVEQRDGRLQTAADAACSCRRVEGRGSTEASAGINTLSHIRLNSDPDLFTDWRSVWLLTIGKCIFIHKCSGETTKTERKQLMEAESELKRNTLSVSAVSHQLTANVEFSDCWYEWM